MLLGYINIIHDHFCTFCKLERGHNFLSSRVSPPPLEAINQMTIYYFIGYVYGSMHYKLISKIGSYLYRSWFLKMAKLGQEFVW